MRQADEVATEILRPAEKRPRVILAPGATGACRSLFVNIDPSQENRFAVQQDVGAADLNRTKPNAIAHLIGFAGDFNLIKLRILRRPKRQARVKRKLAASFGVRFKCLADAGLGDSDSDLLPKLRPIQLYPAFNLVR